MATEDHAGKWLVETDWLAEHLDAPGIVILDGSMHLPTSGRNARAEYLEEHIPGALFFDIDDIADEKSPLPHMLPSATKFSSRMKKMGIGDGMDIIAYDSEGLYSAARVWWMFRAMGDESVRVLNGGLKKWKAEGRPLEDGEPRKRSERHFTSMLNAALVRDVGDVQALIGSPAAQIVDARSAGRFTGAAPEPRKGLRSGRIPGSRNVPFGSLLNPDGTLRPAAGASRDLRRRRGRDRQARRRLLRLRRHGGRHRARAGRARPGGRRRLRWLVDGVGSRSEPAHRDRPGAVVQILGDPAMSGHPDQLSEAAVRDLEEQRYRAMLGADLATLDRLLDGALTYTHSSGVVDTKASYLAGIRDKVWEYRNIARQNERVVVRGDTALVFCRLRIDLLVKGAPKKVESNALAVWVRDSGQCRLVAVHSAAVAA